MWAACSTEIQRSPRVHNGPAHWLLLQRSLPRGPRNWPMQITTLTNCPLVHLIRPLCCYEPHNSCNLHRIYYVSPRCVFSFVRSYFRTTRLAISHSPRSSCDSPSLFRSPSSYLSAVVSFPGFLFTQGFMGWLVSRRGFHGKNVGGHIWLPRKNGIWCKQLWKVTIFEQREKETAPWNFFQGNRYLYSYVYSILNNLIQ